ncbi:MAG: hypothetical protein B6U73_01585 [Desulfurococcales archaeon ex4484_204]|nr:MAG: hypothetical protein B6U73_01585 [Desulfurococcales archaeon ex4484_204]
MERVPPLSSLGALRVLEDIKGLASFLFEEKELEVVLLHKPLGPLPPEALRAALELVKKVVENPSSIVPGGRIVAAYNAVGKWFQVCIWDVPSVEALLPFIEGLRGAGINTEVVPAESVEKAIPKWERSLSR